MQHNFIKAGPFRLDRLQDEIIAAIGEKISHLNWTAPTGLEIHSSVTLSAGELTTIETVINAHSASTSSETVNGLILDARTFGNSLLQDFVVENVLLGITQSGKTQSLATYCHKLQHYIETGSLYAAYAEIDAMIDDISLTKLSLSPFITNARLAIYKTRLGDYLGL